MNSPVNFASNLNLSHDENWFKNSMILGISVTIVGLDFFLITFSDEDSSSVAISPISESAMISLSFKLGGFSSSFMLRFTLTFFIFNEGEFLICVHKLNTRVLKFRINDELDSLLNSLQNLLNILEVFSELKYLTLDEREDIEHMQLIIPLPNVGRYGGL